MPNFLLDFFPFNCYSIAIKKVQIVSIYLK